MNREHLLGVLGFWRTSKDFVTAVKNICGERQNILWRASKTYYVYLVFVFENSQLKCKDTK